MIGLRRVLTAVAAVATVTALAACGGESAGSTPREPKTFTVDGTLTLEDSSSVNYAMHGRKGEECWGEQGYDDIRQGAQVVIRDSTGAKVALGALEQGTLTARSDPYYSAPCEFPFTVDDVPVGKGGVFSVEVTHRGEVSFEQGDALSLTLGS